MIVKLNVIESTLNDVGKKFDYRNKEVLFDRFKGWFDGIAFAQISMSMGWGKYQSSDGSLIIGTACFDGGEWLDTVQHNFKANNIYNSYVNAIAYWDMLNDKGKEYWMNYYSKEIIKLKAEKYAKIADFKSRIENLQKSILDIDSEVDALRPVLTK